MRVRRSRFDGGIDGSVRVPALEVAFGYLCRNYELSNYGPGPFLCGAPTNCGTLLDVDGGCLAAVADVMDGGGAACEGDSTFLEGATAVLTTLCGP